MCDCFKSNGDIKTEIRTLGDFNRIELDDNINLILKQDTINRIEIEAGGYLLKLIKTDISDRTLTIRNNNKCNWVRSYKKEINAYLRFKSLESLIYRGSGNISCEDTIQSPVLYIETSDGSGVIDLTVKSNESYFKEHIGPADFIIKGKTSQNYIWAAGYGKMDCGGLQSETVLVINRSTNDCYVNACKALKGEIYYNGNIYYKGNPANLTIKREGEGRLIRY
jgi:hypothetical protein